MKEPLQAGAIVSHYRLISRLGRGGMGEVYLAEDSRLGRKVALKFLPAAFTQDAARLRRFEQEARSASTLNHPNIVTVHEIGQAGGTHYIAGEFIDGQTLRQRMASEKLTLSTALDVTIQMASALAAAHEAGIVHRDIKPENVMVRRDGIVKVLDFGLAKLMDRPESAVDAEGPTLAPADTEFGTVVGTARYMSPEQANGQKVDARSDIFSLGIVLYELVAGKAPFDGISAIEVMGAILHREAEPLSRCAPDVPSELERIVEKALRKDSEERYQTSKDLLVDLKRLKREIEFKALESSTRPAPPDRAGIPGGSDAAARAAASAAGDNQRATGVRTASVAGRLIGEIRRHTLGASVAMLTLMGAIGAVAYLGPFGGGGQAIDSLAVLPFVNASANPDTEYLSDGITDSLINGLSQVPKLKVMSRNSVFRYKGSEVDAQKVGHALGVRAVLTGRVTERGNDLVVNAELVDVGDNSHLWGEQYTHKLADLLAMQGELSRDISEQLRLRLSGEDRQRLTKRYTENPQAYELYLKGRYFMNALTDEGLNKGLEYFQRAIATDPRYAPAYAGVAEYYATIAWPSTTSAITPKEAFLKAKAAASKAVELDDTLAEAHTSLGLVAMVDEWDWKGAEREFRRAIALNPNYVSAHHWYSHYLISTGRFQESLAESERALDLDPLDAAMNFHLSVHYVMARQYDLARRQLQKTLDMDPNYVEAHAVLGLVDGQEGLYQQAFTELQTSMAHGGSDQRGSLGYLYAVSGQRGEARRLLDQLQEESRRKYVSPYGIGKIYAGLGERDQAFAWLERAVTERDGSIVNLKVDQEYDSLRSDPRFADLLRRTGLSQ